MYVPDQFLKEDNDKEKNKEYYADLQKQVFKSDIKEAPIKVTGSESYVEPKAWIKNTKIRNLILFGNEFDEKFYW